jgi:hypothetical protein
MFVTKIMTWLPMWQVVVVVYILGLGLGKDFKLHVKKKL